MKALSTLAMTVLSLGTAAADGPKTGLTNGVPLGDGVYLSLTDESGVPLEAARQTLTADKRAYWHLQNSSTNKVYIIFLGARRAFSFRLLDGGSVEITKTATGQALSK